MMDCQRILEHLHAHLEGESDPIRAQLIQKHLEGCEDCRRAGEDLKLDRIGFVEAAVQGPALSDSFTQKVLKRIEKTIRADALRRRRAQLWRLGGLAAAAALILAAGVAVFRASPEIQPGDLAGGVTEAKKAPGMEDGGAEGDAFPVEGRPGRLEAHGDSPARPREIADRIPVGTIPPASVWTTPFRDVRVEPLIRPAVWHGAALANFGHVLGMAERLAAPSLRRPEAPTRDDPCKPDPNKDGKTDINDVAYSCQVLICGQPPRPLEVVDSTAVEPVDCDDYCFRA